MRIPDRSLPTVGHRRLPPDSHPADHVLPARHAGELASSSAGPDEEARGGVSPTHLPPFGRQSCAPTPLHARSRPSRRRGTHPGLATAMELRGLEPLIRTLPGRLRAVRGSPPTCNCRGQNSEGTPSDCRELPRTRPLATRWHHEAGRSGSRCRGDEPPIARGRLHRPGRRTEGPAAQRLTRSLWMKTTGPEWCGRAGGRGSALPPVDEVVHRAVSGADTEGLPPGEGGLQVVAGAVDDRQPVHGGLPALAGDERD